VSVLPISSPCHWLDRFCLSFSLHQLGFCKHWGAVPWCTDSVSGISVWVQFALKSVYSFTKWFRIFFQNSYPISLCPAEMWLPITSGLSNTFTSAIFTPLMLKWNHWSQMMNVIEWVFLMFIQHLCHLSKCLSVTCFCLEWLVFFLWIVGVFIYSRYQSFVIIYIAWNLFKLVFLIIFWSLTIC
jgi:hypothetical protein